MTTIYITASILFSLSILKYADFITEFINIISEADSILSKNIKSVNQLLMKISVPIRHGDYSISPAK